MEVLVPSEQSITGQSVADASMKEISFYHASEGKPLATPWQVAITRADYIAQFDLPSGMVLDCACGSGIQLAAYASRLKRPALGVELDRDRAVASCLNLNTIANRFSTFGQGWHRRSLVLAADGTASDEIASLAGLENNSVSLLMLDPARPRNSRTHGLEEMQPNLPSVFEAWKPYLASTSKGPCIVLDLSPRLTQELRDGVESIVESFWPGIDKTWTWMSRGGGRVDRLELWLGGVATPNIGKRFVRLSRTFGGEDTIIEQHEAIQHIRSELQPARRNEWVTILDAALVESGLVDIWLGEQLSNIADIRWAESSPRRPRIHHNGPLKDDAHPFVVASGRVVEILDLPLDEVNIDTIVAAALENDISALTIRCGVDAALQPRLQGSIDRQLRNRQGRRKAFLTRHTSSNRLLLCVQYPQNSDT
ncbi:MAG: hypothetical protein QGG62_03785 [Candidatus Poseidoniaceae archaeon]|nr:hypothetical protein [Candidatus Poseidoniaceae archaeon]